MSAPWGISQLVSTVAARALASPHVGDGARRLFAAIAEMATYTEARRLDVWESEVLALQRTAIGRADDDDACEVARALFDLGRMNMYGEIELEPTIAAYRQLVSRLVALAIDAPSERDVDWQRW